VPPSLNQIVSWLSYSSRYLDAVYDCAYTLARDLRMGPGEGGG